MIISLKAALFALLVAAAPAAFAEADHEASVIIKALGTHAPDFSSPSVVTEMLTDTDGASYRAEDLPLFEAADGSERFLGYYRTWGAHREVFKDPYGVDEYMHFLDGSVTLRGTDGVAQTAGPGDVLFIPAGWTGVWESSGYVKLYMIVKPAPSEESAP